MICAIEDCDQVAKSQPCYRGWCMKHYTRWYRHGDPLYARQSFDLEERLFALIDASGDCWEWTGTLRPDGYGQLNAYGRIQRSHRVVYEWLVGPIPEGLTLDHLCRNRACVNPDHLEPVDRGENVRRGIPSYRKATCKRGHTDWIEYGAGHRYCGACRRALGY